MSRDDSRICGTARASMSRMGALIKDVERLRVTCARQGDRLVVEIENTGDEPIAHLNVHHSATPRGGFPFLASALGVQIGARETVRLELDAAGRDAPFHILFQRADAFLAHPIA